MEEQRWDSNNLTWPNFKPKKWKENTKRKENKEEYRKNRDSNLKTEKEYIEREENKKNRKGWISLWKYMRF